MWISLWGDLSIMITFVGNSNVVNVIFKPDSTIDQYIEIGNDSTGVWVKYKRAGSITYIEYRKLFDNAHLYV